MCNWCVNKITIQGDNLRRLQRHFTIDEHHNEPFFDFNTIVEMPKELNIEKSSRSWDGFLLYLAYINPSNPSFGKREDKLTKEEFKSKILKICCSNSASPTNLILKSNEIEEMVKRNETCFNEVITLGKQIASNYEKYGTSDWYDWSLKNWGTKWNSCNSYHNDDFSEIYFDSAWSPALPVIEALAKMYPDLDITHEWAEEQTGWYSGKYSYHNGKIHEAVDYDSFSKEAYEMSFELWGDDESYRFNKETGNYEYIEEGI